MMTPQPIRYVRSARVLVSGKLVPAVVGVDVATSMVVSIDTDNPPSEIAEIDIVESGCVLAPVPSDIHFHGAGGVMVAPTGAPDELHAALDAASVPGYRYLATLPFPRPNATSTSIVEEVAAAAHVVETESRCLGVRLEGCFVSPDRAGIWPPESFCAPDAGLLDELIAAGRGQLKVIDVAPELPGALDLIAHARERDLVVALAHSAASYSQACAGFDAGATIATHLFNAMTGIHHREPGLAGAALVDQRVFVELIADGVHVHPAVCQMVIALAPDRVIAISDASPFAGMPPGTYEWAGHSLLNNGESLQAHDGTLAGSTQLLDANLIRLLSAGMSLEQALESISCVGMRAIGTVDDSLGHDIAGLNISDRVWYLDTTDLPL